MKLDKIKKICSEFGNDTVCSVSFNRIKSVVSDDANVESPETTGGNVSDTVETSIVEELPYVYTINTDLKNINIGFTKNINDVDILDDNFEPGILTLSQLSHIIEPYSNDFNVIMNASNETEEGLNVNNLTNFSFNKEFLNHYLFSFLKKGVNNDNTVFIIGEVNKDKYSDVPNTLLVLTKVYYGNTFTNYSYDYGSEKIDIISPDDYNYDTHSDYNNAILMLNISFNSDEDLVPRKDENGNVKFDNISIDDICIIRNKDNRDIFNELISLLFDTNLDGNSNIIDYTFKYYNIKSVVDYLKLIKIVTYEETINNIEDTEVKVNKTTAIYIDTIETIQSNISNYQKQAEIDLAKLYNRLELSDITTNILDGVIHKNFYINKDNDKSYYIDTQDDFKAHIITITDSIIDTLDKISENYFIITFINQCGSVLSDILTDTYDVGTIADFCADKASLEPNYDTSAYYLIDTINYVVNYENGVRSSKMYFNMLNTENLTSKLKLGNNIIYEYKNNISGISKSGEQLYFSPKNIGNKLDKNKITHYFYDDMDFGTIMLETKSDLPLINAPHLSKNNVLFIDNIDDDTDKLDEIYIPNCITSLGDNLFSNCADLSLLELPKYLTSIGENIFPNHNITIGYAKNSIDSRLWLNEQFTGTYNYYAPNFNGYNTLLFYPTSETVDISTKDTNDIDIVSVGKQSIFVDSNMSISLTLDSTTEYIDDDAFKTPNDSTPTGTLSIDATNSPLWYVNIPSHNSKFANIDLQLNTLSPTCLYYDPNANHTYTYTNENFAKVQQNALLTITNNLYTDAEVTSLVKTITGSVSIKSEDINLEEIHLTPGCKILNNEIRFIVSDNLTNDKISLNFALGSNAPTDDPTNYIAEYVFHSNIKINTGVNSINLRNFAVYVLNEQSVFECQRSKMPKVTTLANILGEETANTLKTLYIQLKDSGDFESDSFYYYGESNGLEVPINQYYMINKGDNNYEVLTVFIKTLDISIKTFKLSNNALDYTDFANILLFMNDRGESIKSNFINHGSLQYRTKTDSTPLNNIIVFPLFYTLTTAYTQSVNMFLKTAHYLYSIQLSDIRSLSQTGISKLLLTNNFNPEFIEFPESINRFYDCPIIIDKEYNKSELTIRFWSDFKDVITKKTLLDINAIQNQIRTFSAQSTVQGNFTVSTPVAGSFTNPSFSINNSSSIITSPEFSSLSKPSIPTNTLRQNNEVMCICTTDDSLEKLIYINSENLKTLRIQVKEGKDYEHIYNFFKTNINKLVHVNTPNNHVLNIVVETFVHDNYAEGEIVTYNFYDI